MGIKGVSQYRLLTDKVIDNGNITLLTLEKLCRVLDCTPNDVVRFVEEAKD